MRAVFYFMSINIVEDVVQILQKNGRYINKQFVGFNNKLYSCLREVPLLYILLMSVGSS